MTRSSTDRRARVAAVAALATLLAAAPLHAQWTATGEAIGGRVEHRVDAGYGIAASTGTVVGLTGGVSGWQFVEADVHALGGRLVGDSAAGGDRRMGEIGARASLVALPWLAFTAGAALRGYETAAATQRWTAAGAGAEVRLALGGGSMHSVVRTSILPYVRVSGQPSPDLGIDAGAGLHATFGRLVGGIDYSLERYVFPSDPAAGARREQLSRLLVRIGARW